MDLADGKTNIGNLLSYSWTRFLLLLYGRDRTQKNLLSVWMQAYFTEKVYWITVILAEKKWKENTILRQMLL